ncbi:MAG TPA: AMP-binding protein [Solirubrobacter sp.]|nr:AMP-binding protein [Solirubrobacter sp.]
MTPPDVRVPDVIRGFARERPDAIALRHGERELTYAQLDERSSRLAQALLPSGAGARIAYLGRAAPEVLELLFAAGKSGAVIVPLNWRLSPPELAAVLEDASAPLLIADAAYADVAAKLDVPRVIRLGDEYEAWLGAHPAEDPGVRGAADDVIVQMYTSGTTGAPKGVLTTHANLAAAAMTSERWEFDAAEVLEILERQRVTNAVFVPTILQLLTSVPGAAERDYSALRTIAYGASPITTTVLKATLRTFRCRLLGMYGLTESTGSVVQLDAEDHEHEHLLRSAGRPYPWVQLRVVDPQTGADCKPGEVGEVWLRAPNVTAGYFNRPAETASALTAEGWLRTGDGGYLDADGYLFLTDRVKDMIISGGENVYPIEVEEVLSRHPGVRDVAVIGVPDERWGEAVKALVIPADGAPPEPAELVAFARERLAGYKLPRSIEFVEDFPRTPTGKVRKQDLRELYRNC